jgi:hypothetical protein
MNWLARLKKPGEPRQTYPTETTEALSVGFVGTPAGLSQNSMAGQVAANDPATTADPDRWCWPHSNAMNTVEIDAFSGRVHLFTQRHGLDMTEAESLADGLVSRDRGMDDRRLCLECLHLQGEGGQWACGQKRRAGLLVGAVPDQVVTLLQRCNGFDEVTP